MRVIAATHRDLADLVARGAFREDLYWRLNVVHLHVPALREHPEDIPLLARHFLSRFAERFGTGPMRVSDEVFARLAAWHWPGNVRELEHAIEKLVALSHEGELDPALLPPGGEPGKERGEEPAMTLKARVDAFERGLVVEALRAAGGNRTEAARKLGISARHPPRQAPQARAGPWRGRVARGRSTSSPWPPSRPSPRPTSRRCRTPP